MASHDVAIISWESFQGCRGLWVGVTGRQFYKRPEATPCGGCCELHKMSIGVNSRFATSVDKFPVSCSWHTSHFSCLRALIGVVEKTPAPAVSQLLNTSGVDVILTDLLSSTNGGRLLARLNTHTDRRPSFPSGAFPAYLM